MRDSVAYEWKLEYVDQHDDIQDYIHGDHLEEIIGDYHNGSIVSSGEVCKPRICLVRDQGNDDDGLTDRSHAYFGENLIPVEFEECGRKIPKKYQREANEIFA